LNSIITSKNGLKVITDQLVEGKLGVDDVHALVTIANESEDGTPKNLKRDTMAGIIRLLCYIHSIDSHDLDTRQARISQLESTEAEDKASLKSQLEASNRAHGVEKAKLLQGISSKDWEIRELYRDNEKIIKKFKESHSDEKSSMMSELDAAEKRHVIEREKLLNHLASKDSEIKELQRSHDRKMQSIGRTHADEISSMRSQLEAANKAYGKLFHQKTLKDSEIRDLQRDHERKIKNLNKAHAEDKAIQVCTNK